MIDLDPIVLEELDELVPAPGFAGADWSDVERRAAKARPRRRFVVAAVALVAVAFAAVALAQTLTGGFSTWLSGKPGKPASTREQQAFHRAIGSWTGFPQGTQLRELSQTHAGGATFTLFGFRGSGSLCLRLVVSGSENARELVCPPLSVLRGAGPAVVAEADYQVGPGAGPKIQNGPFRFALPQALVTFGIVSDAVTGVDIHHSETGVTRATVAGDAFLSVDRKVTDAERVTAIRAKTAAGSSAEIPFFEASTLFSGESTVVSGGGALAKGPSTVQRVVHGGAIRWLARREPRGTVVPKSVHDIVGVLPSVLFAREITPDPRAPEHLVVSVLPFPRRVDFRNKLQVCTEVVGGRYRGGGCWPAGRLFSTAPFTFAVSQDASGQFVTLAGVASDEVSRLDLVLATGERVKVPLHDNGYLVAAAKADSPLRLVAYDAHGLVIGLKTFGAQQESGSPSFDRPVVTGQWRIVSKTRIATVWSGPSQAGGQCSVIDYAGRSDEGEPICQGMATPLAANAIGEVQIEGETRIITVSVGSDVARLVLHFHSGRSQAIVAHGGYAIARLGRNATPASGRVQFGGISSLSAYNAIGSPLSKRSFGGPLGGP